MSKVRVGVLRGGPSREYEVSLSSGAAVLKNIPEKYQPVDIFIDRTGQWHFQGLPIDPHNLSGKVDVVWNAMHGEYGEDGRIQRVLSNLNIPFTGSTETASAIGMSKPLVKDILLRQGFKVPVGVRLEKSMAVEKAANLVFRKVPPPWVIKPSDAGSSVGLFFAKDYAGLLESLYDAFSTSREVIVEEYIKGAEATVGVVENFRNEKIYPLFPVEIKRPAGKAVWDYNDKYSGETEEVCPGCFPDETKKELAEKAALCHKELGLRHYSRSDFIVSPRGIYLLEVNTLPGLTEQSLLPKALSATGSSLSEFIDHVLGLTLAKD